MSKKKIAMLVVGIVGLVCIGVAVFAYYDFTHNYRFPFRTEQISDAQIAVKGAMGEAIFSGQRLQALPDVQSGKTGLDALLAPGRSNSEGLIDAYRANPQKFKQYADMFDTALNAKQVADVVLRESSAPPRSSDSLEMPANIKVDAWGRPFCIFRIGARVAVVSGGAAHLPCDRLPLTQEEIASSEKPVYAGPAGVVVVVVGQQDRSRSLSKRGVPNGL